jgi:D-xylose transport system permease protein
MKNRSSPIERLCDRHLEGEKMSEFTLGVKKENNKSSVLEQFRTSLERYLISGDVSSYGILIGLILIWVVFELANQSFLAPLNLANMLSQISSIGILSVGVILVLLIGEIDLSIGAASGFTSGIMTILSVNLRFPGIAAILLAILLGLTIGAIQGFWIAKVHVPSFIVTLAGLLVWQGGLIYFIGESGTLNLRDPIITGIANTSLPVWAGWALGIISILTITLTSFGGRNLRARAGLPVKPISMVIAQLLIISIAILVVIGLMNINRSLISTNKPIQGVPSAFLVFLGFVTVFHWITRYTTLGRHIYAVGGNPEAARRASIDVDKIRIVVFTLCSGIAACGGIVAASRLYAVDTGSGSGDVLLNAIAAAVIGGTSLFGGRGTIWSALLGALIIGSINNGMDLLSFPSSIKYVITGCVLLLAVTIDSTSRARRQRSGKG